ncbi:MULTISPECIES: hypothetical protein [Brucella/Ochrobactrum group]|uniref:hypothetical protein n=1 Tax=Brucella/Ochrobactrum group TaxID=2826938 RepID=UPI0011246A34|nr:MULTISPECIES: hypothetical protein [Brucella/Ochrobactrum group]
MSNIRETLGQPPLKTADWIQSDGKASAFGALFSVQGLKQAALRIADVRRGAGFQTRDLVGLLVCHAARNKRLVQPRASMRMTLPINFDRVSVRLTIES